MPAVEVSQGAASNVPSVVITAVPPAERFPLALQYCRANGATVAGGTAIIATDATFDATPCDTSTAGTPGTNWVNLGVPEIDMDDNDYGWFFIGGGQFEILLEAYHAAGDVIYTTSTAPYLGNDDTSFQVEGVKSIDATTTAARARCFVAGRMTVGVVEAHD